MRGGAVGAGYMGGDQYECKSTNSNVGGPHADYLDMHAAEKSAASASILTPIKQENDTHVNTVYVGNMMKMGIFNRRSALKRIFSRQHKHLIEMGLIQVIKNVQSCSSGGVECSHHFYSSANKIIHAETTYGFLGQFDDKGEKNGLGLCYDMSDPNRGRIFIGYWNNGLMNGLGIEVDFTYDAPNNTYKLVGIYYGHFRDGKRSGFGIYYKFDTPDAIKTFFHTDGDGMCTLKDTSFQDDNLKKKFEVKCASTLTIDGITLLLDVSEFKELFFTKLTTVIDEALSKVGRHGKKEYAIFRNYVAIYKNFVDFCKDKLEEALREYDQKANKELHDNERKIREKQELLKKAHQLLADGYFTGKVVDPDELKESEDKKKECVNLLESSGYSLKSPEQKAKENEEATKADLARIPELVGVKRQHDELTGKLKFAKELELSPFSRGSRRRIRINRSSSSSRDSPNPRGVFSVLSNAQSPITPSLRRSISGSRRSSDGGGSLTRKNRRTGKRSMRRKSRRHRRHHRHHHHHH
jgi:hypothetical protein